MTAPLDVLVPYWLLDKYQSIWIPTHFEADGAVTCRSMGVLPKRTLFGEVVFMTKLEPMPQGCN